MKPEILAKYFDHTILKSSATREEVRKICEEAKRYGFFSVCVNPVNVKPACEILMGSDIKVCSVVGFPLGAHTAALKAAETIQAIEDGADEIDMVINVGALLDGNNKVITSEISGVVRAAEGKVVKVIIETCLLDEEQKVRACMLAKESGAHFVKTSTGFAGGGATIADVVLMKKTVGDQLEVKASGGIKTCEDALKMIESGASRIGASAGVAIIEGLL